MPKLNNDIQEDLKKNRPTLLPSIVNLVISVIFIIVITIVKFTTDEISLGLYIGFITVLVMFTLASFINGYLAKKQKTKMLKSYDKETELILEYLQYSKKFHRFEENEKITYKINIKETTEVEKFSYNSEKSSLGFPDTECSMMSIGIGFAGVTINPEDGQIISLAGLLPKSIWLGKKLTPPTAKKATLYLDINGIDLRAKTYFQILRQADTYYDKKTGWLVIGERKMTILDDAYEFLDNAYLVLRDGKVVSLWIKVDPNLTAY